MKKIFYFHYQRSRLNGSSTHTDSFAREFNEICQSKGIEFRVVAPAASEIDYESGWGRKEIIKNKLSRFYGRDLRVIATQCWLFIREYRLLRRERPDAVITRFDGNTMSILWACRLLRISVVLELNSPTVESITSDYRHFPGFLDVFSNEAALKQSKIAFTVTRALKKQLINSGAVSSDKVEVVPNGVDAQLFQKSEVDRHNERTKMAVDEKTIVIGFVGSFAPWHGVEYLLEHAIALLNKGYRIHVMLIGHMTDAAKARLSLIDHPMLSKHLTLIDNQPKELLPGLLSAMDVAVLPNTEDYCSPLKLFEYMACELPVVSINQPGVSEVITHLDTGYLIDQVSDLGQGIEWVISNPEVAREMGQRARIKVAKSLTWQHNAMRVFHLIEHIKL